MKVINVKFSDVAYVNGLEFRGKISAEQPVLVVVNYHIMPFITLMFYPPLNSIWRIYPSMTVCYDEHLEESDADAELIVDKEIQIAGGKMPIAGILNFSDFLKNLMRFPILGRGDLDLIQGQSFLKKFIIT